MYIVIAKNSFTCFSFLSLEVNETKKNNNLLPRKQKTQSPVLKTLPWRKKPHSYKVMTLETPIINVNNTSSNTKLHNANDSMFVVKQQHVFLNYMKNPLYKSLWMTCYNRYNNVLNERMSVNLIYVRARTIVRAMLLLTINQLIMLWIEMSAVLWYNIFSRNTLIILYILNIMFSPQHAAKVI